MLQPITPHLRVANDDSTDRSNACASCLTSRQIYLIINQSNRKYLTCAQKLTASLFITRTELKGMTEEN